MCPLLLCILTEDSANKIIVLIGFMSFLRNGETIALRDDQAEYWIAAAVYVKFQI